MPVQLSKLTYMRSLQLTKFFPIQFFVCLPVRQEGQVVLAPFSSVKNGVWREVVHLKPFRSHGKWV